jgi:cation-transporting P-type ATPase C
MAERCEAAYHGLGGVSSVRGNAVTGSLVIVFNPKRVSLGAVLTAFFRVGVHAGGSVDVAVSIRPNRHEGCEGHEPSLRGQFLGVLAAGAVLGVLALGRFLARWFPGLNLIPTTIIASGAAVLTGIPIFREGLEDVIENKRLSLDLLVSLAAIVAVFMGEGLVALEVVWLMNCGTLLEDYTAERSRRAIRKLLDAGQDMAWVRRGESVVKVAVTDVVEGDVVVVHGGEKILVDGDILEGQAAINEAPITGESVPVEKTVDQSVFAGTLVERGTIEIRALKVGDHTYLARILKMVEDSLEHRAPIERISDRFAAWFVPSAVVMSVVVFAVTRNFYRAFTVLVTACPCAAAIATPTAISAAVGNAARRQMLVKGGAFIEQASRIDTICVDKTGTLTEGRPRVATILPAVDFSSGGVMADVLATLSGRRGGAAPAADDGLLSLAASAELRSTHPLAQALLQEAEARGLRPTEPKSFESVAGQGVVAAINGRRVVVGSRKFMDASGIALKELEDEAERVRDRGETILYAAVDGRLAGLIGVVDRPRPEAKAVVRSLERAGIRLQLLTGDHQRTAEAVSRRLGIRYYAFDLLPADKAQRIEDLKQDGRVVAMVGDGVNDALALARSDLGIAMGAGGSDVAVEAADIALIQNDLTRLVALRELSLKTMRIIKQNYAYSMAINGLGMGLGAMGLISPLMGGLIHVFNSLVVIGNSSRILRLKDSA